jgi:hypothetical protein
MIAARLEKLIEKLLLEMLMVQIALDLLIISFIYALHKFYLYPGVGVKQLRFFCDSDTNTSP